METPKEKAEKLFVKYYEALPQWVNTDDAKKCAIIAVDNLIDSSHGWNKKTSSFVKYWQSVKTEIEKI